MTTIIIADSLIHDFVSPDPEFAAIKVNVGPQEIARTMGEGARYGQGPLPAFLRAAYAARRAGQPIHLVFVRDQHDPEDPEQQPELLRYGTHAIKGSEGGEFVPCVHDLLGGAHVIDTRTLAIPTARLHDVLGDILGRQFLAPHLREPVTFVICGFHTDKRVLATAFNLRNQYGFPMVLVCPHLVGSRDTAAHALALQVGLPNGLVSVVPSLTELTTLAGIPMQEVPGCEACRIEPAEVRAGMTTEQRMVVEVLFLFDAAVTLTPLKGGFSGSLLFLAAASSGGRKQAPVVVKVGSHAELHREMSGYSRVKDLLGTHVPAMQPPVSMGALTGVRMTLAAMEGRPRTLQSLFAEARDDASYALFLGAFEKALALLSESLYENTRRTRKYSPYQELGLTGPQHMTWLHANLEKIIPEAALSDPVIDLGHGVSFPNPLITCPPLLSHVDYLAADVALCHGDLNLANLLTDDTRAIWIIDWPWCDERPIEFDLAKMENDLKYVVAQDFTEEDLPRLLEMEKLLSATLVPPEIPPLPFLQHDLRFRKIYEAVRRLRICYRSLKTDPHVEIHAIALLRFALHTLSFDARQRRGDCELPQLKHALLTVAVLVDALRNSGLHRGGRRDRHPSYPVREMVPRDHIAWDVALPAYAPPEAPPHVQPPLADEDDPQRVEDLRARVSVRGPLRFDGTGRPLNPAGRTGLAGRGWFYRWGPNQAVDVAITRVNPGLRTLEFALVKREDTGQWGLPGVLVRAGESEHEAFARCTRDKLGLELAPHGAVLVERVLVDDYRNTDHAWVESGLFHLHVEDDGAAQLRQALREVTDAEWLAVTPEFAPHLFASHARLVAACIRAVLARADLRVRRERLEELLARL